MIADRKPEAHRKPASWLQWHPSRSWEYQGACRAPQRRDSFRRGLTLVRERLKSLIRHTELQTLQPVRSQRIAMVSCATSFQPSLPEAELQSVCHSLTICLLFAYNDSVQLVGLQSLRLSSAASHSFLFLVFLVPIRQFNCSSIARIDGYRMRSQGIKHGISLGTSWDQKGLCDFFAQ